MAQLAKFKKEELVHELVKRANEKAKKEVKSVAAKVDKIKVKLWKLLEKDYKPYFLDNNAPTTKALRTKFGKNVNSSYPYAQRAGSYQTLEFTDKPSVLQPFRMRLIMPKTKEGDLLDQIFGLQDALREEEKQRYVKIRAAVMSLNTHKQYENEWPEAYEVLCALGHGLKEASAAYVPMIPISSLNDICGLPSAKTPLKTP